MQVDLSIIILSWWELPYWYNVLFVCKRTPRVSDTNSLAGWMPVDKPTELSRLKLKLELDSTSLWSVSIQPTRPHCQLAFAPGSGDILVCFFNFNTLAQESYFRIERIQFVFLSSMQDSNPGSQIPNTYIPIWTFMNVYTLTCMAIQRYTHEIKIHFIIIFHTLNRT